MIPVENRLSLWFSQSGELSRKIEKLVIEAGGNLPFAADTDEGYNLAGWAPKQIVDCLRSIASKSGGLFRVESLEEVDRHEGQEVAP